MPQIQRWQYPAHVEPLSSEQSDTVFPTMIPSSQAGPTFGGRLFQYQSWARPILEIIGTPPDNEKVDWLVQHPGPVRRIPPAHSGWYVRADLSFATEGTPPDWLPAFQADVMRGHRPRQTGNFEINIEPIPPVIPFSWMPDISQPYIVNPKPVTYSGSVEPKYIEQTLFETPLMSTWYRPASEPVRDWPARCAALDFPFYVAPPDVILEDVPCPYLAERAEEADESRLVAEDESEYRGRAEESDDLRERPGRCE